MGIWPWQCTPTGLDNSTELRMEKIHQAVTEIWVPQVWQPPARPPARPPGPWRQYPSSPEGWGVKMTLSLSLSTIFSLTRESPYLGKTVFIWRWGPGFNKLSHIGWGSFQLAILADTVKFWLEFSSLCIKLLQKKGTSAYTFLSFWALSWGLYQGYKDMDDQQPFETEWWQNRTDRDHHS